MAALGGNIAAENAIRGSSHKIDFTTLPTMAEALKLAAQGFNKDISMLSCCAA